MITIRFVVNRDIAKKLVLIKTILSAFVLTVILAVIATSVIPIIFILLWESYVLDRNVLVVMLFAAIMESVNKILTRGLVYVFNQQEYFVMSVKKEPFKLTMENVFLKYVLARAKNAMV